VAVCLREDIGRMMPDGTWPELAQFLRKDLAKALEDGGRPVRIEISDQDYPAYMGKNPKEVYFTLKMRSLFTSEERRVDLLLRGLSAHRGRAVSEAWRPARHRAGGSAAASQLFHPGQSDRHEGAGVLQHGADADARRLSGGLSRRSSGRPSRNSRWSSWTNTGPAIRTCTTSSSTPISTSTTGRATVKNLLIGSAVLARNRPEYEDWFRYAYELWLYRSPALSRTDGGSMDGNGYLGVHDEPLTHLNWMLHRLTGYNYFRSKRWFAGFPGYMSIMNAAGNPGVPYSDGGDTSPGVPYLTEMLAYLCPENPANLWRFKSQGRREAREFSGDLVKGYKAMALLQLWRHLPAPDLSAARPPVEPAAAFRDVGVAAMHGEPLDPARNLMVNFSSAVNGSFQHLHPSQNAFCIAYGGEPLFWRTGYYNGGAEHDILSYKCSRAHNTILADGLVQGFDLKAYGWLPRCATGQRISYVLGDASQAYTGTWPKYTERKTPVEVPITPEFGFGNPGITRFRRHVALLRPHHVLVYDELEAEKPVTWTFALHSLRPIRQLGADGFVGANAHAAGSVRLFCRDKVTGAVTDQFFGVPVDDENKRGGRNPPNWHVTISTEEKLAATRFLAVIEVVPGAKLGDEPAKIETESDGRRTLQLGDFVVTAELDPGRPSLLEVHDRAGTCALVTGQAAAEIHLAAATRTSRFPGSTLLWENMPGHPERFCEEVDQLPPILLHGNRY
jgi:hypothetical protein